MAKMISDIEAEVAKGRPPQYDTLAEVLLPQIRDFFQDPAVEAEFQEWLLKRKGEKAG